MLQRKINVVFSVSNYDDFDTHIPVKNITDEQLAQLQKSITTATLPADACPTSISVKMTDTISFLAGGARRNRMSEHSRTLEISDLFYLAEKNHHTPCGKCRESNETAIMRHCAKNLCAGKCRDDFMRRTIGAALFPHLYTNDKQK